MVSLKFSKHVPAWIYLAQLFYHCESFMRNGFHLQLWHDLEISQICSVCNLRGRKDQMFPTEMKKCDKSKKWTAKPNRNNLSRHTILLFLGKHWLTTTHTRVTAIKSIFYKLIEKRDLLGNFSSYLNFIKLPFSLLSPRQNAWLQIQSKQYALVVREKAEKSQKITNNRNILSWIGSEALHVRTVNLNVIVGSDIN